MDRLTLPLMFLLLTVPSSAAVHLQVAPGPLAPASLRFTETAAAELLVSPTRAATPGGIAFSAPSWNAALPAAEKERRLAALRALWGTRLTVREDAPASGPMGARKEADLSRFAAMRVGLAGLPRPLDKAAQDAFYDGGRASGETSLVRAGMGGGPRAALTAASPRLIAGPPPPAPAPRAASPISWKRAGWEFLKGAGRTIADVFTWKGLAIAAASVALVTVAPVAIYGLLALGAVFSVWTIGKAVVHGRKAYKAGDAEGFYSASREMGKGVLGLTLTALGARHLPTNLKPHFPSTSGEWRAMAAAMDDEPVIAVSLLKGREKP